MKKIIKGFSYSFYRNIGWQDRTIRTVIGFSSTVAALYLCENNSVAAMALIILAVAQFLTVLSARCIICFFTGTCTISPKEREKLLNKGVKIENS